MTAERRKADVMYSPRIDECVFLAVDLPNQWLAAGQTGMVKSMRHSPEEVYEVDFPTTASHDGCVAMLRPDQIASLPASGTDDGFAQERYPDPDSGEKAG